MADVPILSDIFGSKPDVAGFQDINLGQEQINALLENISAWPDIEQLGNLYQNYMMGAYEKALPGFANILSTGAETVQSMLGKAQEFLGGNIPADVASAVMRGSAFQNITSGLWGGLAGAANTARNLGITSLDLINQGAQLATTAGNAMQRWQQLAPVMSPAGFLITPAQQAQMTLTNRLIQRQIQQERYNVAAAPDPIAHGLSDIVMYLTGQYLGSLGGGKMGGGGGGLPGAGNAAATSAASPQLNLSQDYLFGGTLGGSDVTNPGYSTGGANPTQMAPANIGAAVGQAQAVPAGTDVTTPFFGTTASPMTMFGPTGAAIAGASYPTWDIYGGTNF